MDVLEIPVNGDAVFRTLLAHGSSLGTGAFRTSDVDCDPRNVGAARFGHAGLVRATNTSMSL